MPRYRRRRAPPSPPAPEPTRSRGYTLLDQATVLRDSWGAPNALLEPEKALAWNERLTQLYRETSEAFAAEGNEYGKGIADGWIRRFEETNQAIRDRLLKPPEPEQLPLFEGNQAPNPFEGNLAAAEELVQGVGGQPRVAETEVCDGNQCEIAHFLVRGDHIEFVSTGQVKKVGRHPLDDRAMPSDIKLPKGYVLVHDATGTLLTPCDLYAVKWHRIGSKNVRNIAPDDLSVAHEYFGEEARLKMGSVDIPEGPWESMFRVKFIRYRRYGFANHFEHEYNPAVDLFVSRRPLAWKLALPEGCVVDSRGFVVP